MVCRTGRATELGGLAGALASQRPPDAFEHGIRRFGLLMLRFTIFLVLFVLAANVLFHRPWLESLLFALALAVGLTPELLPMVVTVTLASGAQRLAKRRVIVKRLAAVHDLGAMDVLCTDKTGTLTESRIRLVRHLDAGGGDSEEVLRLAYLLANGKLDVAAWRKVDEVPFDFERRRVSVLVDDGATRLLIVKGAPEDIVRLSAEYMGAGGVRRVLDEAMRATLIGQFERLGEQGYRVLGVASRTVDRKHDDAVVGDEVALTFAGFAVFVDPPKPDAAAAIQAPRTGGCRGENPHRRQRAYHAPHLRHAWGCREGRADRARAGRYEPGGPQGPPGFGQSLLSCHAAAEGAHSAGPQAHGQRGRLSRRRYQRCLRAAHRRCRHLGRQCRRRGKGSGRSRAA